MDGPLLLVLEDCSLGTAESTPSAGWKRAPGVQPIADAHHPRLIAATALLLPSTSLAWGYEGHEIIADIARANLTPELRARVDAILATDTDPLTGHDMAAEATWADVSRAAGHRETAQWHFVDEEIDGSADLRSACFNFPAAGKPASAGPAQDCVVDKVNEFAAELGASDTAPAERLVALKFLLHFVGDLHQPLHASNNHDRGGNCVLVSLGGSRTINLHAYWDTSVVEAIGKDPAVVAARLNAGISDADRKAWQLGTPADWAQEAFQGARATAYTLGSPPGCQSDVSPIPLNDDYAAKAKAAAAIQLERAGVRLAGMLAKALGNAAPAPLPR